MLRRRYECAFIGIVIAVRPRLVRTKCAATVSIHDARSAPAFPRKRPQMRRPRTQRNRFLTSSPSSSMIRPNSRLRPTFRMSSITPASPDENCRAGCRCNGSAGFVTNATPSTSATRWNAPLVSICVVLNAHVIRQSPSPSKIAEEP